MPSLRDMRARIQSVKNTQQITRAMKMVSAAKLRRAQDQVVNMRPYSNKIMQLIVRVANAKRVEHPLLTNSSDERKRLLVVVITSDRGLCGGFNSSVCRYTEKFIRENKEKYVALDFIFIGKKGAEYFKRRGISAKAVMLNLAREVSYNLAANMAQNCMKEFSAGHYDEVKLIYNKFKSAISQELTDERLLPLDLAANENNEASSDQTADIIFEPTPEEMVEELLNQHFSVQIYRCMCESVAAEHAARMTAMENATKNAKEMIERMTLVYNKVRQAAITKELIEICSGAEAVNNQ